MTDTIFEIIEKRSTANLYDATKSISDEQITELVRLATTAPTAFNLQNWKFIAVKTLEEKQRLRKVAWNQAKVEEASVTFIVCGILPDHNTMPDRLAPVVEAGIMPAEMVAGWTGAAKSLYFEQPERSRDEAVRTATFGAGTLILAASALGFGTTPMIGFDPEGVKQEFKLKKDEIPVLLLTVGYATSENWPQKPRRPLSEVLEIR